MATMSMGMMSNNAPSSSSEASPLELAKRLVRTVARAFYADDTVVLAIVDADDFADDADEPLMDDDDDPDDLHDPFRPMPVLQLVDDQALCEPQPLGEQVRQGLGLRPVVQADDVVVHPVRPLQVGGREQMRHQRIGIDPAGARDNHQPGRGL